VIKLTGKGVNHVGKGQLIISIVSIACSSAISIASLTFTIWREKQYFLREKKLERIERLYMPFYKNCVAFLYPEHQFSELNEDAQKYLEEKIFNNMEFASTKSQMYYIEFYRTWLNSPSRTADDLTDPDVDAAFNRLYRSLLSEYKRLCKKTKLQEPPLPL
jgi:hypothetical protein